MNENTNTNPEENQPIEPTTAESSSMTTEQSVEESVEISVSQPEVAESQPEETPVVEAAQEAPAETTSAIEEEVEAIADEEEHNELEEIANDEAELDSMPKAQLLERFLLFTKEGKPQEQRARVLRYKGLLLERFNHERKQRFDAFIEKGGIAEDFDHTDADKLKFDEALQLFRRRLNEERERIERERNQNLAAKRDILDRMRQTLAIEDSKTGVQEFRKLQDLWRQTGPVPQAHVNELWEVYHALSEKFFDTLKIDRELRDLDMQKNLKQKMELCEKAEELMLLESVSDAVNRMNDLHTMWKEIGPVQATQRQEIWDRFKAASDKVYERRREYIAQLDEQRANNKALKTDLCEKAEAIAADQEENNKDWKGATGRIEALFEEWKKIGAAGRDENEALWQRFKAARNTFFHNKNDYFRKIRQDYQNNYNLKLDICVRAEAIMDSNDWKRTSQELIRLQNEWKKVGPVPREHSDALWKRFRSTCDHFFNKKNEHFSTLDESRAGNLDLKKALVARIEAFTLTDNPHADVEALKGFQKEWMEIGPVPQESREELQNHYRKLVNAHFDNLKMGQQEKMKVQFQNRISTLKESGEGDRALRKEEQFLRQKIEKLQSDIATYENNMGFFANSKNAEALRSEIEKKIRVAQVEISNLKEKIKMLRTANDQNNAQ